VLLTEFGVIVICNPVLTHPVDDVAQAVVYLLNNTCNTLPTGMWAEVNAGTLALVIPLN
tara:strand:+ start:388 stop:564 length:177 start_codon:yes stop_codon:yes gene_type:complete